MKTIDFLRRWMLGPVALSLFLMSFSVTHSQTNISVAELKDIRHKIRNELKPILNQKIEVTKDPYETSNEYIDRRKKEEKAFSDKKEKQIESVFRPYNKLYVLTINNPSGKYSANNQVLKIERIDFIQPIDYAENSFDRNIIGIEMNDNYQYYLYIKGFSYAIEIAEARALDVHNNRGNYKVYFKIVKSDRSDDHDDLTMDVEVAMNILKLEWYLGGKLTKTWQ